MNRISLIHQAGALRSYFPNSTIKRKWENELVWIGEIRPTPLSETYVVKLHYKKDDFIKIYVIGRKLKLAVGVTRLPHVYSTPKQQLCLYNPKDNEWHTGKYYVHSIIPWTSEWLFHYEIWVATGKWHGGGIEHELNTESKDE